MARQPKTGLDYFPVDIAIMTDRKLRKVKMQYGSIGFQVYFALLCIIYSDKGYYVDFGESKKDDVVWEVLEKLQGKYQPTAEMIVDVIEDLVACELFSGDLFKSKIITSKRIQSTYYSATVERDAINVNFDIWLLSIEEMTALSKRSIILQNYINRPIIEENRTENEENRTESTQSKVKKSKVKKSKVDESNIGQEQNALDTQDTIITFPLNDKTEYPILRKQVREWTELYPAVDVLQQLRNMKGWLTSNPTKRKTKNGILRFITGWLSKEQDKGGSSSAAYFTNNGNTTTSGFKPSRT